MPLGKQLETGTTEGGRSSFEIAIIIETDEALAIGPLVHFLAAVEQAVMDGFAREGIQVSVALDRIEPGSRRFVFRVLTWFSLVMAPVQAVEMAYRFLDDSPTVTQAGKDLAKGAVVRFDDKETGPVIETGESLDDDLQKIAVLARFEQKGDALHVVLSDQKGPPLRVVDFRPDRTEELKPGVDYAVSGEILFELVSGEQSYALERAYRLG